MLEKGSGPTQMVCIRTGSLCTHEEDEYHGDRKDSSSIKIPYQTRTQDMVVVLMMQYTKAK